MVKEPVKLKKKVFHALLAGGYPKAADKYRDQKVRSFCCQGDKNLGMEGVWGGRAEGLSVGLKDSLVNSRGLGGGTAGNGPDYVQPRRTTAELDWGCT